MAATGPGDDRSAEAPPAPEAAFRPPDGAVAAPRRWALPVAFLSLSLVQAASIVYFEPPDILLSTTPVSWSDFDTHWEQTLAVTDALDGWGEAWAYDPQLLAGFPNGTIFDADNKAWELWTYGLWKLGVPRGLAFNLFLLLANLLVPWTVYLAARLFRLGRPAALVAAWLGLAVWTTDGVVHLAAWVGMTAYAMSAYLCLLPIAFLFRYLEERRTRHALGLTLSLPVVLLVHPYSFGAMVVPMAVLYLRARRSLGRREHATVWGAAALAVAANLWWLLNAFRFWSYILDSDVLGGAQLQHLATDYLGLVLDRSVTGGSGMRTGFRFLAFAAAAAALVSWRSRRDSRFVPFVAGLGALLGAAYLGGYSAWARHLQPYRFVAPAVFLAIIPAAAFLTRAWSERRALGRQPRPALLVLLLLLVAAVPRLARDVLFAWPAPLPDWSATAAVWPQVTDVTAFGTIGFPRHRNLRRDGPFPDHRRIADLVRARPDDRGRVLVEDWVLGEHLAGHTDAEVMGGFRMLNLSHSMSNLFRRYPRDPPDAGTLRAYLERYAVQYAILSESRETYARRFPELLRPLLDVGEHRVFRTTIEPSRFQENEGNVRASLNRIAVTGTDPARDVVLRYHWMETLVCRPGCTVAREPIPDDPVGFIRVPAPHPADFVVENGY